MDEPSPPWFQIARPRPAARRRLFCLAHAGGGASLYRGWGERLPGSVEVVAVQPPGREGRFREPPFTDWRPLVAELADAMRPLLDRPFALFGHSLGALLAYELARRLRDLGAEQPDHLFAAALAAPHLPNRREQTHTYADAEFRESLRRRGGTPPAVLGHAELMDLLLPMLRADLQIAETYRHGPGPPLACPVTVFGGTVDTTVSVDDLDAWRELTTGPFQRLMLSGDHFFPQADPAAVCALIARELDNGDWPAVRQPPSLSGDDVHVWLLDLDPPENELAELALLLDDAERARAERFHFRQHHDRFTAGRGLLRSILGRYLGVPPGQVRFRYGFAGKPEIDGATLVRFNLSHSEGLGLLAVTQGRTVGADIERVAPQRDLLGLADRFFAPRESAVLRALPEAQRAAAFYTCWTRKEAYLKAHGGGLSVGLDTFEVLPLTGPPVLTVAADPAEARRWSLCDLAPTPGFAAALAVEGQGWRVRCARWA